MRVRFQADADLDGRILRGLRRNAPEIDIRTAADAGLAGLKDPEVLRVAADDGRVLVSQDRHTMPGHFARHITAGPSPGVILLREAIPISIAIEELILIWSASEAAEWIDRLAWIPSENCPPTGRTTTPIKHYTGSRLPPELRCFGLSLTA